MPAVLPIIAGVAVATAAVGTYTSIKAQKKQAKYQKQADKYQRNIDNLRQARSRVQSIREARLAAGQALQASVNQGAQDTSASLGGLGSIQSQLNSNLSFLDRTGTLADQASIALGKANKQAAKAQTAGAITSLAFDVFKQTGGF